MYFLTGPVEKILLRKSRVLLALMLGFSSGKLRLKIYREVANAFDVAPATNPTPPVDKVSATDDLMPSDQ